MSALILPEHEVHVWRSRLDLSDAQIENFVNILSSEERERSQRFRRERDRQHFISARGSLREILGRYLDRNPRTLKFSYRPKGKPYLADSRSSLEFNLSHSNGLALYALCHHSVGIDLEYLRPLPNANLLAQRFFTHREGETLNALPENRQQLAFFKIWTRKEAYLKATGEGLAGLQNIEVSLSPNSAAKLISIVGEDEELWTLYDLQLQAGYVGALAVKAKNLCLRYYSYQSSRH